ncbi:PH domain-containing protein [Sphingobacterium sp. UDSM-2020]|uniref:PH domain-containing protein n=1 Tax=Sphingobacterium sp. UDSM-2020 TaxID=2795738 RepID=UPI001938B6C4|nr:PH domain-containing protein [Sphingobacterium sp. UDSM-2020]QQD11807.1 PH domain-containing protein [Sphingobacterium sp. UDSM-2020]
MNFELFAIDGQDIKIVEKLVVKLQDMMTEGERIDYIAVQKKPAVTILPDSITISNKRIFMCEFTKLGLATDFEIFSWKDIKDIAFKEEIFGSKVTVIPSTGENLSIDYIPKVQARKLYQLIKGALETSKLKEIEQEREKFIVTAPKQTAPSFEIHQPIIEEEPVSKNTPSLPIVEEVNETIVPETMIPPTIEVTAAAIVEEDDEITLKLRKLKNLFDKQLITQAEYENKKNEILSQI